MTRSAESSATNVQSGTFYSFICVVFVDGSILHYLLRPAFAHTSSIVPQ